MDEVSLQKWGGRFKEGIDDASHFSARAGRDGNFENI